MPAATRTSPAATVRRVPIRRATAGAWGATKIMARKIGDERRADSKVP